MTSAVRKPKRPARPSRPPLPPPPPAWQVTAKDLNCLDDVRSLLSALNDAYVSTRQIQELVANIPVLRARCVRRIGSDQYDDRPTLDRALTKIGNMGVEGELLGLLEDLTTCRADQLEQAEADPEETG